MCSKHPSTGNSILNVILFINEFPELYYLSLFYNILISSITSIKLNLHSFLHIISYPLGNSFLVNLLTTQSLRSFIFYLPDWRVSIPYHVSILKMTISLQICWLICIKCSFIPHMHIIRAPGPIATTTPPPAHHHHQQYPHSPGPAIRPTTHSKLTGKSQCMHILMRINGIHR